MVEDDFVLYILMCTAGTVVSTAVTLLFASMFAATLPAWYIVLGFWALVWFFGIFLLDDC